MDPRKPLTFTFEDLSNVRDPRARNRRIADALREAKERIAREEREQ